MSAVVDVQAGHGGIGVVPQWDAAELSIANHTLHGVLKGEGVTAVHQPPGQAGWRQRIELVGDHRQGDAQPHDVPDQREVGAMPAEEPDGNQQGNDGLTECIDHGGGSHDGAVQRESEGGVDLPRPELQCRLDKESMRLFHRRNLLSVTHCFCHIGRIDVAAEDVIPELQGDDCQQLQHEPDPGGDRGCDRGRGGTPLEWCDGSVAAEGRADDRRVMETEIDAHV